MDRLAGIQSTHHADEVMSLSFVDAPANFLYVPSIMAIVQLPFNPKEWSNSIPAWLVAFGFLVGVFVWAAKQLGLARKEEQLKHSEVATGETHPDIWHKHFDELEALIEKSNGEHIAALRDLTAAINNLTMTLLRGK